MNTTLKAILPDPTGGAAAAIVKQSFLSVFAELNASTEAWWQASRLSTDAPDSYVAYIQQRVGVIELFAAHRSVPLSSSFVRVSVSTELERERYRSIEDIERAVRKGHGTSSSTTLPLGNTSPVDALDQSGGAFALLGPAGSGKTTLFRYLALQAAQGRRFGGLMRIPFYLAVRDMRTVHIREEIERLLASFGVQEVSRVVTALFRPGRAILLLDGLDETSTENQKTVIAEIEDLRARFPQLIVCLSARPLSLSRALPGFRKWETRPLLHEDKLTFIQKWFLSVAPEKGERLAQLTTEQPALLDLGSSPLLLAIICALYHNDLEVPSNRDELYERAILGLLGQWDAFRSIARNTPLSQMSIRQRLVFCSWIAAALFDAGRVAFTADDLRQLNVIPRACTFLQCPPVEPESVLESLYTDFGLMLERSPGAYSFSHLSLQEYLAARFIVDQRQEVRIVANLRKPEWHETLRLIARMLPDATAFLLAVHQLVRIGEKDEVAFLAALWKEVPRCGVLERRRMFGTLAQNIAGAARRASARYRPVIEEDTLVLECSASTNNKLEPRSKEKTFGRSDVLFDCFPELWDIIRSSGFNISELGVASSPLFIQLERAGGIPIRSVIMRHIDPSAKEP